MKLKTLLVNPRLSRLDFFKETGRLQPLGLTSLAAYLRTKGRPVEIFDAELQDASTAEILKKVRSSRAEIVGFPTFTPNFQSVIEASKRIKKLSIPPKIVIGGPHISAAPSLMKNFPFFDYAVLGEGEETLLELIQKLEQGESDFEKINGLAFWKKGKLVLNASRGYIRNLDLLPFPARDLLPPLSSYHPSLGMYRELPMATMATSRGCPYQCIFCSRAVFGNLYRARSPKNVVDEIEILLKNFNVREIKFLDDTFNLEEERVLKICRLIRQRGLKFTWTCLARTNCVTQKMLKDMKKAGCWQIAYGIESGSQRVLDIVQKGQTLEIIQKAVSLTKNAGIETRGFFMFGLPGDSKETMCQTINFAKSLKLDVANFYITIPFPGTELLSNAKKFGRVKRDLKEYLIQTSSAPPFIPYGLTSSQIKKSFRRAYREFYFRPSYLGREILKIRSWRKIKAYLEAFWIVCKTAR